ncbi:two-component system, response regulator YesN [Paenibacillus catalpae]|uniref:Two-component system, response regulator YesN n=1 Tax=Paenibacillus catalpae TaxID=1045775 RepID=A0A1I1X859_9BACL|nr:response regulator [Paenibacillus catalpae]SFE01883.1 two-component system, response regulator YesN [Paenibacillus catalpae]
MYRVLLVDDEPFAIEGLQLLIDWEKNGFAVESVCGDGEEAARVIRQSKPDLVVTDIRMPSMDGLELIEQMRLEGHMQTKFVVMSGYSDFEYARRALQLGVSHYLTKPIMSDEADEVLESLNKVLEEETRKRQAVRHTERYAQRRALLALIRGEELSETEQGSIERISEGVKGWVYMRVELDESELANAIEAAQEMLETESGMSGSVGYIVEQELASFGLACMLRDDSKSAVRELAELVYGRLRKAMSGSFSLVVGSAVNEPDDLSSSYRHMLQASAYLFFDRRQKPLYYEDIKEQDFGYDSHLWEAAEGIIEAVETNDEQQIIERLQRIFDHFARQMTMPSLISAFSTHIMVQCSGICKELGGDAEQLLERTGSPLIGAHEHSLLKLQAFLLSFCLLCREELSALRNRQQGGTIAKVEEYLRQHYRESITVKEIAEIYYMNPVYLGQAFTRKYGVSIHEYIHRLRMDEAKEQLHKQEISGAALAEGLGYCSYQHFLKQFEKRYGMKLAEYKKTIMDLKS